MVLALGEINPGFGGEQVLVADGENGAPLGSDTGFARLIVPGINSEAEMVFGSRASNCFRVLDQVTRVRRIVENGDWRSITRLSGLPSIHI